MDAPYQMAMIRRAMAVKLLFLAAAFAMALPAQGDGAAPEQSGLRGRTILVVGGGAENAVPSRRVLSMEFAVVPIDGETAKFDAAIYVTSDPDGTFQVALPPGKYRIVPKEKALDPEAFKSLRRRPPILVVEQSVVIEEGAFTDVDVIHAGEAP